MNKNKHKPNKKLLWLLMILPIAALACGISARGGSEEVDVSASTSSVTTETTAIPETIQNQVIAPTDVQIQPAPSLAEEQSTLISLYLNVNPSVVNITTYIVEDGVAYPSSQGSGFVIDLQGHIVTNAHVVHGSSQIDVAFSDGIIEPAEIVGQDLHSDLAVIKVEELAPDSMPVELGEVREIVVGETVVAIGNPFGLGGTLTRGIVSALGRTIPALTSFSIPSSIQTDAAINPGNSGGPLLNLEGEVIGVNAQIQTNGATNSNQGVGFAIPVSIVKRVVPELIANGHYDWAWLGVMGTDMTPTFAEAMDVSVEKGAYLSAVVDGGPANNAGLLGSDGTATVNGRNSPTGGDVIVAINGEPVSSFDDLLVYIALESSPGSEVILTILRNGEFQDITVKLDPRPDSVESLLP